MAEARTPIARAKSSLLSRNVTVAGHRTSVRLEPDMWDALQEVARRECRSLHQICTMVDQRRAPDTSLTAAIRVFVMAYFRAAATESGHEKAGHGSVDEAQKAASGRRGDRAGDTVPAN